MVRQHWGLPSLTWDSLAYNIADTPAITQKKIGSLQKTIWAYLLSLAQSPNIYRGSCLPLWACGSLRETKDQEHERDN